MSIIKKSFYLAEIYTSRVLYFECMSTDSYESSGSVDYAGIKKICDFIAKSTGKMQLFSGVHFSFVLIFLFGGFIFVD